MKKRRAKLYLVGQDPVDIFNDLDKLKSDLATPPALAKTFPPVESPETGLVPMVKVFVLFPAAIVTLAGT